MKILMLHNRYLLPGGEEQSCAAETALLREMGHEVELLEEDNRRIEELGQERTAVRTIWSRESYGRIQDRLRAGRHDILHVHNFFPLWSPSVYYAASRCGVPVVQTLHNYRLMCANALFFRDNAICQVCLHQFIPFSGIAHACYRDSRAASSVVAAMIGFHKVLGTWKNRVQVYVAVSEHARETYIQAGLPAEKIAVKPNFLHPAPEPGPGGGGYALYAGRLSPEKGILTMLSAWKSADCPLPLKIAGSGPLQDVVTDAARLTPTIEYVGSKPLPELLQLMGQAEFLVFPSESYETMGRTIMEAFAAGTPALVAAVGPPAAMVVPDETGFHFAPGNIAELRQRVEWCSRNLARLRAMRGHARAAFEKSFTGPANAEKLLSIYRQAQQSVQ